MIKSLENININFQLNMVDWTHTITSAQQNDTILEKP
jgi:hypothetical protein